MLFTQTKKVVLFIMFISFIIIFYPKSKLDVLKTLSFQPNWFKAVLFTQIQILFIKLYI